MVFNQSLSYNFRQEILFFNFYKKTMEHDNKNSNFKMDDSMKIPKVDMKNFNINSSIQQFISVLKCDKHAIETIAKDEKAGAQALIFFLVGVAATPLGLLIFVPFMRSQPVFLVTQVVLAIVGALLAFFAVSQVATKIFKGHGSFADIFRVGGLVYGVNVISLIVPLIPSLGALIALVALLWMLVVHYVTVKTVFKLDDTNTILTILISIVAVAIVMAILSAVGIGAMMPVSSIPEIKISL